jgi:3-oxoadipate enol-lactonase
VTAARLDGRTGAPVLLLANSLGTTQAMWEPQLHALCERFAVLRYDHPGHGEGRGDPAAHTVGELAHRVLAVLDERGIARVSACGLSLGGAVAMELALLAPQRVDRLVLACTAAGWNAPERWRERAAAVRAHGVEAVADMVVGIWFAPRTRTEHPELVQRARAMMTSAAADGYAGCCDALEVWAPGDALARIAAPTLVIAGAEDLATPPDRAEEIARRIPGARLAVLEGAGHLATLEQPERFTQLRLDHLAPQPAGIAGEAAS